MRRWWEAEFGVRRAESRDCRRRDERRWKWGKGWDGWKRGSKAEGWWKDQSRDGGKQGLIGVVGGRDWRKRDGGRWESGVFGKQGLEREGWWGMGIEVRCEVGIGNGGESGW